MSSFLQNAILWTLALYGLFEIIKAWYCYTTYKRKEFDGVRFIIAAKNEEENIEGILRSIMFKILYGKEEILSKVILTDLNSNDRTKEILLKLAQDYENVDFVEIEDLINVQ